MAPVTFATQDAFCIGIKVDGSLWTWGMNEFGQLGIGNYADRSVPTRVGADNDWVSVAAGCDHAAAIKEDGSLWTWGWNIFGALGIGNTTNQTRPVRVGEDNDWAAVTAGLYHTAALKEDGSLWTMGMCGPTTNVPIRVGEDNDWASLDSGSQHNFAFKGDGSVWVWGSNNMGCIGDGTTEPRYPPVTLGAGYALVSAGFFHTAAIRDDGGLWGWGYNYMGQVGDGTEGNGNDRYTPTRAGAANDWRLVDAGYGHSLAIKNDGSLWAWGYNSDGQLGLGFNDGGHYWTAPDFQVGADRDWVLAAAGGYHSMALKSDGSVWGWGANHRGQLGDGTTTPRHLPVQTADGFRVPD
jgi:alpha-tubulin suppressor-like RCC1 family protein